MTISHDMLRAALLVASTLAPGCTIGDADVGELGGGASTAATSGPAPGTTSASAPTLDETTDTGTEPGSSTGALGSTTGGASTDGGDPTSTGDSEESGVEPNCCADDVSWHYTPTLQPVITIHSLTACATFGLSHDEDFTDDTPPDTCETDLACQGRGQRVGVEDVAAILDDPELAEVLEAGSDLYGASGLPVDSPDLVIEIGAVELQIGEPCSGGGGPLCTPIPAVLAELSDVLNALASQERDGLPCAP